MPVQDLLAAPPTVEAALRDTFEHQDAEIAAGLALFETPAALSGSRSSAGAT